jgi:hypothetical protein
MPSTLTPHYYQMIKNQIALWNTMSLEERRLSYAAVSIERDNFSREVDITKAELGKHSGEWITPHQLASSGIIIHLHGGAFAVGNAISHRAIGTHLAQNSGCKVLMLDYPLCPENPYPAALMDVVEVFQLLKKGEQNIALSGDSAGGNLAITASLYLEQHQLPLPNAIGLMSPWTDLTLSNASHQSKASVDPYFPNSERLIGAANTYAGSTPKNDALISPQFAKIKSFPPTMTHVGELEVLIEDAQLWHKKLQAAQIESHLEVYPMMWHVWQHFVGLLPEATQSIEQIAQFLKVHLQK